MPIGLAPSRTATKQVTPPDLDPKREWFSILSFLPDSAIKEARAAATTTITQGSRIREEFDQDAFATHLINAQVKGWQLEVPPDVLFDGDTMSNDDGVIRWRFTPSNVAKLTAIWDIRQWLNGEIQSCGGIIPTEKVVIKTGGPQVLDYFRPDEVVGAGGESEVSDSERDPVVRETVARPRNKRTG